MTHSALGFEAVAIGGSLGWWVSAPAKPPLRRSLSGDLLETVSPGSLPSFARKGDLKVMEVYRYAAANGETLQYIPCFCSRGDIGHQSNAECYVAERLANGYLTFTSHGGM